MNKILSGTILSITLLLSLSAHADYNTINCESIRGTGHILSLIVFNQDLKQVRVEANNRRPHPLVPTKVSIQSIEGITVYSLLGMASLLEVDNKVLEGNGGIVKLENDEFSCF